MDNSEILGIVSRIKSNIDKLEEKIKSNSENVSVQFIAIIDDLKSLNDVEMKIEKNGGRLVENAKNAIKNVKKRLRIVKILYLTKYNKKIDELCQRLSVIEERIKKGKYSEDSDIIQSFRSLLAVKNFKKFNFRDNVIDDWQNCKFLTDFSFDEISRYDKLIQIMEENLMIKFNSFKLYNGHLLSVESIININSLMFETGKIDSNSYFNVLSSSWNKILSLNLEFEQLRESNKIDTDENKRLISQYNYHSTAVEQLLKEKVNAFFKTYNSDYIRMREKIKFLKFVCELTKEKFQKQDGVYSKSELTLLRRFFSKIPDEKNAIYNEILKLERNKKINQQQKTNLINELSKNEDIIAYFSGILSKDSSTVVHEGMIVSSSDKKGIVVPESSNEILNIRNSKKKMSEVDNLSLNGLSLLSVSNNNFSLIPAIIDAINGYCENNPEYFDRMSPILKILCSLIGAKYQEKGLVVLNNGFVLGEPKGVINSLLKSTATVSGDKVKKRKYISSLLSKIGNLANKIKIKWDKRKKKKVKESEKKTSKFMNNFRRFVDENAKRGFYSDLIGSYNSYYKDSMTLEEYLKDRRLNDDEIKEVLEMNNESLNIRAKKRG